MRQTLIIILIVQQMIAVAQKEDFSFPDLQFHQLPILNGKQSKCVTSVCQDDYHNYWIGTCSGLKLYDGVRFYNYPYKSKYNTVNLHITSLYALDSILWVGTKHGLYKINIVTRTFEKFRCDIKSKVVDITSDCYKNIWIAALEESIVIFNNGNNQQTDGKQVYQNISLLTNNIKTPVRQLISVTSDSNIVYAASYKLIFKITSLPDTILRENISRSPEIFDVLVKIKVHEQFLLFLTPTHIGYCDTDTLKIKKTHTLSSQNKDIRVTLARDIQVDKNKMVWVSSENGMLVCCPFTRKNTLPIYYFFTDNHKNNAPIGNNNDIFLDKYDNLFISTYEDGCYWTSLQHGYCELIDLPETEKNTPLSERTVINICFDKTDKLWYATRSNGIYRYDPQTKTSIHFSSKNPKHYINDDIIRTIYCDEKNDIWIKSNSSIGIIDGNTLTFRLFKEYKPAIHAFEEDYLGRLWIAGRGLNIIDPTGQGEINYSFDAEDCPFAGNIITSVKRGINPRYMFISSFLGLNRLKIDTDGQIVENIHIKQRIDPNSTLKGDAVWHFIQVSDKILFVLVNNSYINKITIQPNGAYKNEFIDPKVGFIHNLFLDDKNNIWLLANKIYCYDHIVGKIIHEFSPEWNRSFIGRAFESDQHGCKYIGTTQGIIKLHPDSLVRRKPQNEIRISAITINGKDLVPGEEMNGRIITHSVFDTNKKLTFRHYENNIGVRIGISNIFEKPNTQYQYKLLSRKSPSSDWQTSSIDETSIILFNNLRAGKYKLAVKRPQRDSPMQVLTFTIKRHAAFSIFSLVMYTILGICLIAFVLKVILKNIKAQNLLETREKVHEQKILLYSNLTHSLRTPLSLMIVPLKELISQAHGEHIRNSLLTIYTQANKLLQSINNILDFKKDNFIGDEKAKEKSDITEIIRECSSTFQDFALGRGIDILLLFPDQKAIIVTNKSKLHRLVTNCLHNVILYSEDDSKINISIFYKQKFTPKFSKSITKQISSAKLLDYHILINFKSDKFDYRIISKLVNASVFKPGINYSGPLDNYSTLNTLVNELNGELQINCDGDNNIEVAILLNNSVITEDAAFNFARFESLKQKQNTKLNNSSQNVTDKYQNKNILLVEDNVDMQILIKEIVRRYGNVILASDGQDALAKAREFYPDLIITDWMMPVMDGLHFTKEIKNDIRTSHIPIIVISAKSESSDKTQITHCGADYYITKPFEIDYLQTLIETVYKNRVLLENKIKTSPQLLVTPNDLNAKDLHFLNTLNCFIQSNISNPDLKYDKLADNFGMSKTVLFQKIKSITGKTPGEYIKDNRVEHAAKLMISSGLSVSEASYQSGFSSLSGFTSAFKKRYNITPSEYIQSYMNIAKD